MALDFDVIIPGRLWVGGCVGEGDVRELQRVGITDVVNLQTDEDLLNCGVSPGALALAYEKAGIALHRVQIPDFDREGLWSHLCEATAEVEAVLADSGARLYLHCTAGVNRSPTTAAAYLIKQLGMPAIDAFKYMVSRRPCNPTLDLLEDFEASQRK